MCMYINYIKKIFKKILYMFKKIKKNNIYYRLLLVCGEREREI